LVVRVVLLGGRRYEVFTQEAEYAAFAKRAAEQLRVMEPLAATARVVLAVENHKDFRTAEQLDLLKKFGSDWLGVCLDTGNNLALLEDPTAVVAALAPLTKTVHLKDIAVEAADDGFRMAEVPLGQGFLDLKTMIATVRKASPAARFQLEMITRDPLPIPCLVEKYWATLGTVPGRDLARTLRSVRTHARKEPLPRISELMPESQRLAEDRNVRESFDFAAREKLLPA
jgi:sugar phosphate isomerase/epimerase